MRRVTKLKRGDIVYGKVTEVLSPRDLIVSLDGELLRVANATGKSYVVHEEIRLIVEGLRPLQFKLAPNRFGQGSIRI